MVKREPYETPNVTIQLLYEDVIRTSQPSLEEWEDPDFGENYS